MVEMSGKGRLQKLDDRRFSLDVRGFACPYPQVLTLRGLDSLSSGDILELVLDNPPSVKSIPDVLKSRGHEVMEVQSLDANTWKILIRVK